MNEKENFAKTKKLARITRRLCKIAIIMLKVGIGLLLIATLLVYIIPADHIKPLTDSGHLSINIGTYDVPSSAYETVEGLKNVLLSVIGTVVAGSVLFIICAKLLIGLLKSVENGAPFEQENAHRLRSIGITLIIGSFVKPLIENIPKFALYNLHQLGSWKSTNNFDVTLLLCGLLVIVLSGVFAYGAYLQSDHDQTV